VTCLRRRISSPRFQPLKGRDSCLWDASLSEVSGARKSCSRWIRIDRPRVVRVLERIAADLDSLGLVPNDPQADKRGACPTKRGKSSSGGPLGRES
jgi:hypothetical protein